MAMVDLPTLITEKSKREIQENIIWLESNDWMAQYTFTRIYQYMETNW